MAGDIFDVPTPPTNALKLLYDFIFNLGLNTQCTTYIITGNHDSSTLLDVPKDFFKNHKCHIVSNLDEDFEAMNLYYKKGDIKIGIKMLPYFRNYELVNNISDTESEDAVENYFKDYFSSWNEEVQFKILMAHHGFGKYSAAGSEHAIFLSGLDYFPLEWLKNNFDYVALGHIHKKQLLQSDPPTLYPGSPIPMRFSEKDEKKLSLISITTDSLNYELIPIPQTRNLITVKTNSAEYIKDIHQSLKKIENQYLSYFEVQVKMNEPVSGIADRIREILSHQNAELLSYIPETLDHEKQEQRTDVHQLSLEELFIKYYSIKYENETIPDELLKSFNQLIEEINSENS